MENQDYIFVPMGEEPTKVNLKKNFWKSIVIVAVCCAVASNFGRSDQQIYYLVAFIAISLLIYCLRLTSKFIRHIKIDPAEGTLYLEYLTYQGAEGTTRFDLMNSEYSYRYSASKGYNGYIMKIKDKQANLELRETKSEKGKDQKNRYLREQLDSLNEIILRARNMQKMHIAFLI